MLFPEHAEQVTLQVPLAERVQFPRRGGNKAAGLGLVGDGTPTSLLVEVQAGQKLQVYEASVTITAKLNGLRWFMYHHRVVSFLVGTGLFWAAEVVLMVVGWGVGGYMLRQILESSTKTAGDGEAKKGSTKGKKKVAKIQEGSTGTGDGYDPEHETDGESTMSDTERTFPSRSGAPALKYEPGVIKSEEDEAKNAAAIKEEEDEEDDDLYDLPVHLPSVKEAGHEFRDSGIGTSGHSDAGVSSSTTAVGSGSGSAAATGSGSARNRRGGRKE